MSSTLSPVTVQIFSTPQGELICLVGRNYTGLTPNLKQIIRAFEFTQNELAVCRQRGYAQGRGAGSLRQIAAPWRVHFLPRRYWT